MCAQVPVCEVTYLTRYVLNTIVLPLSLILVVAGTWTANKHERSWHRQLCLRSRLKNAENTKAGDVQTTAAAADGYDEQQALKYSDYYFAVFLCCKS